MGASLNNLAALYHSQGRYAEAEPLHKRALAIAEKALGPEHHDLAQSLRNYSALLHKTGLNNEAIMVELRAEALVYRGVGSSVSVQPRPALRGPFSGEESST